MKMKLLCLTMSILMLLSCLLTGCSSSTEEEMPDVGVDTVDQSAKTITMWVLTDKETTPRAQELVNKAFTKITKSSFKTNVEIVFCSAEGYWDLNEKTGEYEWVAEGYYDRLEKAIEANEKEKKMAEDASYQFRVFRNANKGKNMSEAELRAAFLADPAYEKYWPYISASSSTDEEVVETEEETVLNEYQIPEIKYPEAGDNQVDIFYIGDVGDITGESKYKQYYKNEWLASLGEELAGSSSKLNKYISPTLLNGVQMEGMVYGIPNNVTIGQYTYMMIDYDLLSQYRRTVNDSDTVADTNIGKFLQDVMDYNEANGLTPDSEGYVVPLDSSLEECLQMLVWYWDLSYVDRSVYDVTYGPHYQSGKPTSEDRNYVIMQEYKYTEMVDDPNNEGQQMEQNTYETRYAALGGMLYKVNADGKYVDIDGNVLNYHYELDAADGGYIRAVAKSETGRDHVDGQIVWDARGVNSWYLVDENGNTVKPEDDKRVVLADVSLIGEKDADGNLILTEKDDGTYEYKGHPVEIAENGVEVKYDSEGRVMPTYEYASADDSSFSVVGALQKDPATRNRGQINLGLNNLFADASYVELYTALMGYEYDGCYGTPDASKNQTAAISFRKGDARVLLETQDTVQVINGEKVTKPAGVYIDPEAGKWYRAVVAENPVATGTELYGNMFAVYSGTNYLNRAMEVITAVNTNTELRDLLQYGVKGVHYAYEETLATKQGEENIILVKMLAQENELEITDTEKKAAANGIYSMTLERTGNCFVATPTVEQGIDVWNYAKIQNYNSLIDPLLGFDFATIMDNKDALVIDARTVWHLTNLNESIKARVDACTSVAELTELINNADNGLLKVLNVEADALLKKTITPNYDVSLPYGAMGAEPDKYGESPNTVYYAWLNDYGYLADE